ncbi:holin, partial [Listeria monocytogenes]|nr:holin [Listeria monocytogenes]EJD3195209.1 holin [Listeria monocytogenes]ELB6391752.1 holin [Listeria monocytogenes]MBX9508288.1 holin [Listeria monocytogenes]MBX9511366.1 holin [Listeria monocytogenes]
EQFTNRSKKYGEDDK